MTHAYSGSRLRSLRHALEGGLLNLGLALFRACPLDLASALGGRLGRLLGPRMARHPIARANLQMAMPELDPAGRDAALTGMWDNLGRTLAEFAHLERIYPAGRVEVIGEEHVRALRDDGTGGIFFSAHYGNWELLSIALVRCGIAPVFVYRPGNNPALEQTIQRRRLAAHAIEGVEYLPKSVHGMRQAVRAIREGRHLAMLVDQKMNRGIPVPFFGREAMTAPAIAQIGLRYRVPLIPARVERLGGANFRLTVYPPMPLPDGGDEKADAARLMRRIHALFEDWIRERPDQWYWLHRRWPRE